MMFINQIIFLDQMKSTKWIIKIQQRKFSCVDAINWFLWKATIREELRLVSYATFSVAAASVNKNSVPFKSQLLLF